jgi:signal transduction histidine kinase
MKRKTLRRRLYRVLLEWFLLFLGVSGIILGLSYAGLRKSVVEDRLLLARTIAHSLDATVSAAIQDLGRLASQLPSIDPETAGRLRAHRFRSPFHEATYVLGAGGAVLVSDPPGVVPIPHADLPDHEAVTRLVRKAAPGRAPVLAIIHPFRHEGAPYHLVAEMSPVGSSVSTFLRDLTPEPGMHIAVVDESSAVIASVDSSDMFLAIPSVPPAGPAADEPRVAQRHPCEFPHEGRPPPALAVSVPLRFAPWHVVVQQHESEAFAAAVATRRGLLIAGVLLAAMGFLLSRTLSKSVVTPIQRLSERAERSRHGDLESRIEVSGDYEIELLAENLDEARSRLASTMRKLQALNDELETKVAARTEIIRAKYRDTTMLRDVAQIGTREQEPARIATESLRRIAEHWSFPAAALVTRPLDAPPQRYVYPPDLSLPWLDAGEEPPETWCRREIGYEGRPQGHLFHPCMAEVDDEVIEAAGQELATALHGSYLWERTVSQDEQRKALVGRLLDASEEERRRIARGLHDEISQLLTVVRLSLDRVDADTPEMTKAKNLLRRTQKEIHRIIHDLRPSVLDNLGLASAMKSYAREYLIENGAQVSLEIEELPLSPEIETTTFRIYQEIVTNILRHANAENVSIELGQDDGTLMMTIEDDGSGFEPEERFEGSGIVGMRERASLVNGTLRFDSEPGLGTLVRLEVPLR